ncbi:MAG: DUF6470 family protein [Oscillospiraceae bacterium]|jgi:hypothetical protein|nr:DUF6470 family protein [Oscillospiraceae bacterium]
MNHNLLNITNIPISVEINIVKGELRNPNAPKPKINITTGDGGIQIHAENAKINIDTYAARSSMGYGKYNSADFTKKEADKGIKLAYEGTARVVKEGNALAKGTTSGQLAVQNNRAGATIQTIMEHIPKTGADVTFEKGRLNINYEIKDVNVDWENLKTVPLQFIPGRVEFNITQMPQVVIEYTGRPIYVPPSADPYYNAVI